MCHRYDEVWAVVDPMMPPKKCVVIDVKLVLEKLNGFVQSLYILRYEQDDFEMYGEHIYTNQVEAEIHWAICFQQAYQAALDNPIILTMHDYEEPYKQAVELLTRYNEEFPEILLKYI